jgi:hypothetical protein
MSIETDLEDLFPPRPGGMVDSARKAAQTAADAIPGSDDVEAADGDYSAIRVVPQAADTFTARSVNVPAGGTSMLLPEDLNRKRATILVSTSSATVVLSQSRGNADNGVGFTLPAGVPLPVEAKGMLYVSNAGASSVSVSVLSELYAPGV